MKKLTVALVAAATILPAGVALTASDASADVRVRIGGSAHVRIGGGARVRHVRPHWRHRHIHRPVVYVGGHIWLGGGYYYERPFAQPPPPSQM